MNEMDSYPNYNADFSQMDHQLDEITQTMTTLLYIVYTLLGLTTIFVVTFFSKLFYNRFCKTVKVVTLSEESVKLISTLEDKIDDLNYKVAVACEIEKPNKETKNDEDFDPSKSTELA